MFWVGFGLLGGILLRLAATSGWSEDFGPFLLCDDDVVKDWDDDDVDGDIFWPKDWSFEGGKVLAKDIVTPNERMSTAMAKIIEVVMELLQKDFILGGCLF